MARLRTSKLQQLGGAAGLGVYFLFAMWRAGGSSVEDTAEGSFFGVLIGAAVAFVVGWFALPAPASRIGPQAARRRSERRAAEPPLPGPAGAV